MHKTLALTLLPLLAHPTMAGQVQIDASKDNTLYNDPTGGTSNGLGEFFFVGRNAGMAAYPIRRGVIAFDVAAAVPAGSVITSVSLTLNLSQTISGPIPVSLHRLTRDWGEGTSDAPGAEGAGAPATAGDATWVHAFWPSDTWSKPGGEFVGTASATVPVDAIGSHTWRSTPALVADVQAWLDAPGQSFGWILIGAEGSSGTAKRFDSLQSPFPSLRPVLTVDFDPPPATYCTAKTTSSGCVPTIGSSGTPSASAGSGFTITTQQVEAGNPGIFFYGKSGQASQPFQGGTLCVQPPLLRIPAGSAGGSATCSGAYSVDFNAYVASGKDPALVAGTVVDLQTWFRDPPSPPGGTGLSDALEFTLAP